MGGEPPCTHVWEGPGAWGPHSHVGGEPRVPGRAGSLGSPGGEPGDEANYYSVSVIICSTDYSCKNYSLSLLAISNHQEYLQLLLLLVLESSSYAVVWLACTG